MVVIFMESITQKTFHCAAIADAVVYLANMVRAGHCKILRTMKGQPETLFFVLTHHGARILVSLAFDANRNPVVVTTDEPTIRWLSAINWSFVLLHQNKIIFHGENIEISPDVSVPGIIIEMPLTKNVSQAIARYKKLGIAYGNTKTNTILQTGCCDIIVCV